MDEYINREVVLSKCQQIWSNADETTEIGVAIINIVDELANFVETIPSADVQPVKRGRWMYPFYCSECGFTPYYSSDLTYNYCPNCGARMDGGSK